MEPQRKKSGLEFLQDRWFGDGVALAIRSRLGLFRYKLTSPGGSPTSCGATPLGIVVPFHPVVSPLKRLEVRQVVVASFGFRNHVIDLPSNDGGNISIFRPADQIPADILPDDFGAVAGRECGLPPDGGTGRKVEFSTVFVGVVHCTFLFAATRFGRFPQSRENRPDQGKEREPLFFSGALGTWIAYRKLLAKRKRLAYHNQA